MQIVSPTLSCTPFDVHRNGLIVGEGGTALVLESYEHAIERGVRIYAEIVGYGGSSDHHHLTAPCQAGQVKAIQRALRDANLLPRDIQYVNAHGTGTAEGDKIEIASLKEVFGCASESLLVSSTKSTHGHLMGGAGAIEALLTTMTVNSGIVPPTAGLDAIDPECDGVQHVKRAISADIRSAMSSSFAFGGSNSVLIFSKI